MEVSDLWPGFAYEFEFKIGYGWTVRVAVDHSFDKEEDLEIFRKFSQSQRKRFAEHVFDNYGADKFHVLKERDILNPFAKKVREILGGQIQACWFRQPSITVLVLTGFYLLKFEVMKLIFLL